MENTYTIAHPQGRTQLSKHEPDNNNKIFQTAPTLGSPQIVDIYNHVENVFSCALFLFTFMSIPQGLHSNKLAKQNT